MRLGGGVLTAGDVDWAGETGGIFAGAGGAGSKSPGYDSQPLLLGRDTDNGAPNFFLQGRIDEAAIYNRALSVWEIASIHGAGPAGKRIS
jgi:concanavalin A-like lectin/glucanase superfamily protein